MCLNTGHNQVWLKILNGGSENARQGVVICLRKIAYQFDCSICAFRQGGKQNVIYPFHIGGNYRDLSFIPFFEKERLFDGVIIKFVDDQSEPGCIQRAAAFINGQLFHQIRHKFDWDDYMHRFTLLITHSFCQQFGDVFHR